MPSLISAGEIVGGLASPRASGALAPSATRIPTETALSSVESCRTRPVYGMTTSLTSERHVPAAHTAPRIVPIPAGAPLTTATFSLKLNFDLSSFASPTISFQGYSGLMCQSPLATTVTWPFDTLTSTSSSARADVVQAVRNVNAASTAPVHRESTESGWQDGIAKTPCPGILAPNGERATRAQSGSTYAAMS